MNAIISTLARFVDSLLRTNPLVAAIMSFGGFVIIFISVLIGIDSFEYVLKVNGKEIHKQVGFIWAFNWSIGLIVLMPLLLYFGFLSYRGFKTSLASLASKQMVSKQDGTSVSLDDLFDAWKGILVSLAIIVVVIIGIVLGYAYWEYREVVGQHFEKDHYPEISLHDPRQEKDWSIAALLTSAEPEAVEIDKRANKVFSLVVYLLLPGLGTGVAFGFFFFLIGFIWYLIKISDKFVFLPDLNDSDSRRGFQVFAEVVENAIWVTMTVFLICYLMIIQNLFLRDESKSIFDFMVPELRKGYEALVGGEIEQALSDASGLIVTHPGGGNLQAGLSFVVAFLVTVIIVAFVIMSLRHIARECQQRVLERLKDGQLVPTRAEQLNKEEQIKRARDMNYWPASWPKVNTLLLLVFVSVLCIVFYKFGLFFAGAVIVCLVAKVLLGLKRE